jgi:hypothetical protein
MWIYIYIYILVKKVEVYKFYNYVCKCESNNHLKKFMECILLGKLIFKIRFYDHLSSL